MQWMIALNSTVRNVALVGVPLLIGGWAVMWSVESYWNPIAFAILWTGAALLMWAGSGRYPGVARHAFLAALSLPLWWYFELVNRRVSNWAYVGADRYEAVEYAVFASLDFSTVVPAVIAAVALLSRFFPSAAGDGSITELDGSRANWLIATGFVAQASVLAAPQVLYPLVWIAPFLVLDGLIARAGGRSMVAEMAAGVWGRVVLVGAAGVLCGFLWEFWNFWAFPKWVYDIPFLGFVPVFEMPILGYGGYVPFAWSIVQVVYLADLLRARQGRTVRIPGTD